MRRRRSESGGLLSALRSWLAGAAVLLLGAPSLALPSGMALGSSSHSLHYVYTAMSEPNQGLPQFISVAYVDGQLFSHYDSVTRRRQPRAAWIKKVEEDIPQYWATHSQRARNHEHVFRGNLEVARNHYNHSRGEWRVEEAPQPFTLVPSRGGKRKKSDCPMGAVGSVLGASSSSLSKHRKGKVGGPELVEENGSSRLLQGSVIHPPSVGLFSGVHSMQVMITCELRKDGSKRSQYLFAYDGRDYISLDTETLTWTAADPPAQITKRRWEKDPALAQRWKAYLEGECIEWLQRYLEYGKERLLRTEPPVGKVTRMFLSEGRELLVCQAHGFYPKEIEATWRKGGEIMEQDTFRRSVAPNSDGTYHAWLSIEINPEDRELYRCHIDHAGLTEPLVLAWEAPGDNVRHIVGIVLGVLAALLLMAAGVVFFRSK
uniref:H-2 class I histocompatibility antigen, Q7 alpha chain-like n=1 Tax=Pogona vitticeps TaxID=103695 RepID=A0ABM5FM97_9SAUR